MAAIFYDTGKAGDIFRSNMQAPDIVQIDFLQSLLTTPQLQSAMIVLSNVEVSNNETVQFFMTFDDVVQYFYFGKGIGQITVNGTIFSNFDSGCNEQMPGIQLLYKAIGTVRGQKVLVSFGTGGPTFQGVITSFRTSLSPEPVLVADFSISISVVDHSGFEPSKQPVTTC